MRTDTTGYAQDLSELEPVKTQIRLIIADLAAKGAPDDADQARCKAASAVYNGLGEALFFSRTDEQRQAAAEAWNELAFQCAVLAFEPTGWRFGGEWFYAPVSSVPPGAPAP